MTIYFTYNKAYSLILRGDLNVCQYSTKIAPEVQLELLKTPTVLRALPSNFAYKGTRAVIQIAKTVI